MGHTYLQLLVLGNKLLIELKGATSHCEWILDADYTKIDELAVVYRQIYTLLVIFKKIVAQLSTDELESFQNLYFRSELQKMIASDLQRLGPSDWPTGHGH